MRRDCAPLGFILLLLLCPYAWGDGEYELVWYTIDAGGVTSNSGGDYSLGGTIGQADTQTHAGGDYELRKGFWVGACEGCLDCEDEDYCTCDACIDGVCTNSRVYGDVVCNGVVSVFDVFCILECIAGDCGCCCNCDIEPCGGNGVVSVLDAIAVLRAIAGVDPCCGSNICCDPADVCSVEAKADCEAAGGTFAPGLGFCTPDPCTLVAACCVEGTCTLETGVDCVNMNPPLGGVWLFNTLSCDPNPCGAAGTVRVVGSAGGG